MMRGWTSRLQLQVKKLQIMMTCLAVFHFSSYEILAMWNQVLKWDTEQDPSAAEQQQKRNWVWTECRDRHKAQEWTTYPSLTVGKQLSAKNKSVTEEKKWQWQLAQIPTARTWAVREQSMGVLLADSLTLGQDYLLKRNNCFFKYL